MTAIAPISYLDALNPAQRRAVIHDVGAVASSPLLVIAGAVWWPKGRCQGKDGGMWR